MKYLVKKQAKSDFYEIFERWSNLHKFPLMSKEILPENAFVCYNEDDDPIYSVWFYHTDSKLAWTAFPMSNKNIRYNKRERGLDFLFNYVNKYAKKKGYLSLITTSNTKEVISSLEKNGFLEADMNVNQYVKKL